MLTIIYYMTIGIHVSAIAQVTPLPCTLNKKSRSGMRAPGAGRSPVEGLWRGRRDGNPPSDFGWELLAGFSRGKTDAYASLCALFSVRSHVLLI